MIFIKEYIQRFFFCFLRLELFLCILLFLAVNCRPLYSDVIGTLGLYQTGVEILKKPDLFFHGYQYEAENLNPSFFKKHLPMTWRDVAETPYDDTLPYNFFKRMSISFTPSTLLMSVMNYSIKGHVLTESVYLPQITLDFAHQFYLSMYKSLPSNSGITALLRDLSYMSFSTALILSKSVRHDIKVYGGYRFAYGWLDWTLKENLTQIAGVGSTGVIDPQNSYVWQLHDLVFGLSFLLPNSNWETSSYVGFDPSRPSIFLKLEFSNRFFGVGLGYYPNNFLKIRPYFRFFYDLI